ncbi:MAG: AMP-binding protein, partial [Blastocatellia bacterium]|nr:AMP-binding protein [Blastocatellia bacterium]
MQKEIIRGFRLSSQQERLWLQQRGDAQAYLAHLVISIEGRIDTGHLEASLQKVVDQNEILRTAFHCLPSLKVPLQVIADEMNLPMDLIDSDGLDTEDRQSAISRVLNQAATAAAPPDFTALPLVRASFLRLSATEGLLALRLPALCADIVGLENLVSMISRSYADVSTGEDSTDEPVQYADLSEWQHEMLLGELDEDVRQFWQKPDYSLLSGLSLPFELRPSGDKPFNPVSLTRVINSDIAAAIGEMATRHNTSISVFLLSCWQSLLYRLMRRNLIMIGACYDGRNYEELKYSLGIFARYLPMQVDIDGGASFIELLGHLDCLVEECGEFQEYFSWNCIARSDEDAVPGFFPICFDFHARPLKYSGGGAIISIIKRRACIDRFRIKLSCIEQDGSLFLSYDYDPEFFYESDMERLADGLRSLVESVIDDPSTLIDRLHILDHTATARLLVDYNLTHRDRQSDKPVHHLFESWAESVPTRMAVRYEEDSLSYDSLNRRANQLAHYLIGNGVGPDTCVVIGLERSLEIIVSLLAILKAGGAYMPLDMGHPKQRLRAMVEEAQAQYIVTRQALLDLLPEGPQKVTCLDSDWPEISCLSEENPPARAVLDNLAYLLFTSGSTGKPKGVAIEHAQLANYVEGILPILQLPDGASFALVSTFSADLGNTVIFPSLCSGGSLHVLSQECAYNPESLAAYFDRHAIDCLKIVPSHLYALLAANSPQRVLPRRRLILGGEASRWDWVEQLPLGPACSVINHYGPTETTIGVLTADLDKSVRDPRSNTLPLGKPIKNVRVYVLDQYLQPVPVYTTGEIYISGEG